MVEKSEFMADSTFLYYKAKILSTGVIDPEKAFKARFSHLSAISIWRHLKNLTRPLRERPFCGRFIPIPR